jgi:predicted ATPase
VRGWSRSRGRGGSGKTRLAIEAAAELVGEFRAGVFWVGLATIRDSALVLETVAQTLGAKDELKAHIGERELLLLLDNLEQVVAAAPGLADLVETCPNLSLLVTSRELLRVRGEVELEVLPLADPDAVSLFCLRAQLEATPAIEELCRASTTCRSRSSSPPPGRRRSRRARSSSGSGSGSTCSGAAEMPILGR